MNCGYNCSTCKRVWNGGCINSPKRSIEYKIDNIFKDEDIELEDYEKESSFVEEKTDEEMLKWIESFQILSSFLRSLHHQNIIKF